MNDTFKVSPADTLDLRARKVAAALYNYLISQQIDRRPAFGLVWAILTKVDPQIKALNDAAMEEYKNILAESDDTLALLNLVQSVLLPDAAPLTTDLSKKGSR